MKNESEKITAKDLTVFSQLYMVERNTEISLNRIESLEGERSLSVNDMVKLKYGRKYYNLKLEDTFFISEHDYVLYFNREDAEIDQIEKREKAILNAKEKLDKALSEYHLLIGMYANIKHE